MAQNPLVEQAKQGHVNAIASLMNRLLKSQGMLANVEREGDRLEILIESDLRSLDDEVRIPKRQILVGMLKKWFLTLEVQNVSSIIVSWQQTGFEEPAWTEEIYLVEQSGQKISENGGVDQAQRRPSIPPLPLLPHKSIPERNKPSGDRNLGDSSPDLDEMFGEIDSPTSLPNLRDMQSSQDPELLFLSDVPSIPDHISNIPSKPTAKSTNNFAWHNLFSTPIFAIQMVQYIAICAVIILGLRGIHAAFGSVKTPKAASISPQVILLK